MRIGKKVDHIIVGQGLAGSCLAFELLRRGKKILVYDEPEKNRASSVAAGLFNPITGGRMSKSWKAEEIFPHLIQFYKSAENILDRKFVHEAPIYRPFVSIEEQNEWMARSDDTSLKNFIQHIFTTATYPQVLNPLGGILIQQSGYLDVNSFMDAVRTRLMETSSFFVAPFDASRINMEKEGIQYNNILASSLIFCEGLNTRKNPFFHWLPVRPLKGETITVSIDEVPAAIFNRGVYLVPTLQNKSFTVGATYQPNDDSEGISEKGKLELDEKLKELIKMDYQVTHQNWGIRPTTPDRKPILGEHPMHKNLLVFNGLGTKGVSLAPYFSTQFADWMEGKTEIQNEVNIQRFKALYSKLSSL